MSRPHARWVSNVFRGLPSSQQWHISIYGRDNSAWCASLSVENMWSRSTGPGLEEEVPGHWATSPWISEIWKDALLTSSPRGGS